MSDLLRLPFERTSVLEISATYAALRTKEPIARVRTRTGDEAWLVTGYEQARAIFADERFGRAHSDPDQAARLSNSALTGGPSGEFATEKDVHDRMRRLLAPAFSARRMQALSGRVQELVDGLLDRMQERGPPLDLHASLSVPLPIQVICELLGVPLADRDHFRAIAEEMTDLADPGRSAAARTAREDVEVDGVTIRAGELCVIMPAAANRDESVFTDPERFDIGREAQPHLGFGYAIRYCLGASLARVELRAVFGSLFQRFPGLRLAVPLDRLPQRVDRLTGGFSALPVTWR